MINSNKNIIVNILIKYMKFECLIKLNKEVKEISTVKIIKALTALLTLKLYKEQQIFNNLTFINVLKKHERNLL